MCLSLWNKLTEKQKEAYLEKCRRKYYERVGK